MDPSTALRDRRELTNSGGTSTCDMRIHGSLTTVTVATTAARVCQTATLDHQPCTTIILLR
jgi:hypothetical protein